MTEAVLAGEEIEKLSLVPAQAVAAAPLAILARLAKDLFMSDRPREAGDGYRQNEQVK